MDQWLGEYSESHRNPTNKLIHWICVPAIVLSVIGLLSVIPFPADIPYLNWGTIVIALSLLFYVRLSAAMALGMLLYSALVLVILNGLAQAGLSIWQVSLGIFVVAWIAQFVGHHLEGKKPSFFKDVQFLLIGPAWVIAFLYRKLGIRY